MAATIHPLLGVCDAIVAALNDESFSQPFTAVRKLLPLYRVSEHALEPLGDDLKAAQLQVVLSPRDSESEPLTRDKVFRDDLEVWLHVVKAVGAPTDEGYLSPDELSALTREIELFARRLALADFGNKPCIRSKLVALYVPEFLEQENVFMSVLALTYRIFE